MVSWSLVAQGRKWVIAAGRTGIALIPIGYGLSTKLWHMVLSECIGYGLLGAGNLATQNAAMDDIFSSNPGATSRFYWLTARAHMDAPGLTPVAGRDCGAERASKVSAENLYETQPSCRRLKSKAKVSHRMYSSITGCLGPIVGAWACNRYPLLALSVCPSLLFFAQAVMFATGPETLPVAERKPFSPGSANAFGSLRLLFANGVGLRCEEKPSASNSRSWGSLKH